MKDIVIVTDLSEVLIRGLYKFDESLVKYLIPDKIELYGVEEGTKKAKEEAKWFWNQHDLYMDQFKELLRGGISEDQYWHNALGGDEVTISLAKAAFSDNLKKSIDGTLKLYQSIIKFPCSLDDPMGGTRPGMPDIIIASDHIAERVPEVKAYHPEVFRVVKECFWSCEMGCIKQDPEFFAQLLEEIGCKGSEILFIDDGPVNIAMASQFGIHGIRFRDVTQLRRDMSKYGFLFAANGF